jgi:hypothetical protein
MLRQTTHVSEVHDRRINPRQRAAKAPPPCSSSSLVEASALTASLENEGPKRSSAVEVHGAKKLTSAEKEKVWQALLLFCYCTVRNIHRTRYVLYSLSTALTTRTRSDSRFVDMTMGLTKSGGWAPSVASAESAVDPYTAWLALTCCCHHFVHLGPIHQPFVAPSKAAILSPSASKSTLSCRCVTAKHIVERVTNRNTTLLTTSPCHVSSLPPPSLLVALSPLLPPYHPSSLLTPSPPSSSPILPGTPTPGECKVVGCHGRVRRAATNEVHVQSTEVSGGCSQV